MRRIVKGILGQTIMDLMIEKYGSITKFDQVLSDNPDIDLEAPMAGKEVIFDDSVAANPAVIDYFTGKRVVTY